MKSNKDNRDNILVDELVSVNWHLWPWCNFNCRFCFAHFNDQRKDHRILTMNEGFRLLSLLKNAGTEKITFVGGEPLLCPWLGELLQNAHEMGLTTMIVTNASLLNRRFLENWGIYIDWVGLSLDSTNETIERELGRGTGNYLSNLLKTRKLLAEFSIKVKVNVTVTSLILQEDMNAYLRQLEPDRLKFFQVLAIKGENDGKVKDLLITKEEFYNFVLRHKSLNPIIEDNDLMTGSYVMIDPEGRFFDNVDGYLRYSEPILRVGVKKAFSQVRFFKHKFIKRHGKYTWKVETLKNNLKHINS